MWLRAIIVPTSGPEPKRVREDTIMRVTKDEDTVELDVPDGVTELECIHCPNLVRFVNGKNLVRITLFECPKVETIENFPSLTEIEVTKCLALSSIRQCAELKEVEAFACERLSRIEKCETLTRVDIYQCRSFREIAPESRKTLVHLKLTVCGADALSDYPALTDLTLHQCKSLRGVSRCESLKIVEATECDELVFIEDCAALEDAHIEKCPKFVRIEGTGSLNRIRIGNCTELEHMDTADEVRDLKIVGDCDKLRLGAISVSNLSLRATFMDLSSLKRIGSMDLLYASNVERVENIPGLEVLRCYGCDNLRSISNLDHLVDLTFENCPLLATITNLPNLEKLGCSSINGKQPVRVTHCPKLAKVEGGYDTTVNIEGWEVVEFVPPRRTLSQRVKPKLRSHGKMNDVAKALIDCDMRLELCTNEDDIRNVIGKIRDEHDRGYYFVHIGAYFLSACKRQAKGTPSDEKLYIARVRGAPPVLRGTLLERDVLPALICTDTDVYGNVHVTNLWISKTIRGANVAQRMILELKPKYYDVALDEAAEMFWDSVGLYSESEYLSQAPIKRKWEKRNIRR